MKMRLTVGLMVAALVLPGLALAQDGVTWIAFSKTKEGKLGDATKLEIESSGPMLDKLLADGAITSWGLATYINHHTADFDANFVQWVTAPGWDGIGKWADQAGQMMASQSPEDREKMTAQFAEIYESRSHYDEVVRNAIYEPGDPTATPPRYFYMTSMRAKPGQDQEAVDIFKEVVVPVVKKLMDEGSMTGFGLQVAALRRGTGFTHRGWWAFSDLGGLDKWRAAIGAAVTPETGARVLEAFHWNKRQNDILMVLHLGGSSGGGEQ